MMRWEYCSVLIDPDWFLQSVLNQYGLEGWELVCVENHHAIFKRRLP